MSNNHVFCCCPTAMCMPPFIGGNSCGAKLEIEIDWTEVQRQQWDNYYPYIQCGLSPPTPCCDAAQGGCCSDFRAECDSSIPALVGTYCNGGTLPCNHDDVTASHVCQNCFNNQCVLWVAPNEKHGYKSHNEFRLCAYGYSAQWIAQNLSEDAACIYDDVENPRQASCNTQADTNTVYQSQSVDVIGLNLDECNCTPITCYAHSGRTEVTVSNNNAIWRIGGWCTDGGGNVLYPARYKNGAECYTLGNTTCAIASENICKFDKSYCAMASNNLLPLTEGYSNFANITRTYPMGAGAATLAITTPGRGYTAGNKSQLVYVSGGAGAPNPNGAPFIEIMTVGALGVITSIAILTNGAGDGISVGQVYSVTGGTRVATITVTSIVAWNAVDNPWYRIKLRTIPEDQSMLQVDPDDEELAFTRCVNLLQVTEDLAHYCKYKDCQALPFTTPCPDPCDNFDVVTQPQWLDTNYPGTGYQSDLHYMGRTIEVDGVDVKTPWVTLAFHLKWVLDDNGDLVRDEIKYHCFGTQKEYAAWWLADSAGIWQAQGTATAYKEKLLWLGIRGDPYNIKDQATGEWYTYGDDHYSECNKIQGIRGSLPANVFCPTCTIPICQELTCLGANGKWLPDNSDEVRIKSMSNETVILEGRERYHYKYQVLNFDRSSQTATVLI
jgi:hypothetical protein